MTTNLARRHNGDVPKSATSSSLFAPLSDLLGFDPLSPLRASWAFDYDVTRTERGYEVDVPVPGYGPGEIEVSFQDNVVTVTGKSQRRNFSRSFTVPEDIDPEKIEARVKDGMLTLMLDRRPEMQPKRIEIKHV
jgi:HSP20 family protein